MGGSRCSKIRNYWNIFVTFLISGIWHGANWTFVVWGCIHGLFQIFEKMLGFNKRESGTVGKIVRTIITFLIINFAWIFFRMPSLQEACGVIIRIFDTSLPMTVYMNGFTATFFISFGLITLFVKDVIDEFKLKKCNLLYSERTIVRWISYIFIMASILLTGVFGSDQFIYANF